MAGSKEKRGGHDPSNGVAKEVSQSVLKDPSVQEFLPQSGPQHYKEQSKEACRRDASDNAKRHYIQYDKWHGRNGWF